MSRIGNVPAVHCIHNASTSCYARHVKCDSFIAKNLMYSLINVYTNLKAQKGRDFKVFIKVMRKIT